MSAERDDFCPFCGTAPCSHPDTERRATRGEWALIAATLTAAVLLSLSALYVLAHVIAAGARALLEWVPL